MGGKTLIMIKNKRIFITLLLLPVAALLMITFSKIWILQVGQELELPISGYDPRDLLSGHYLTYRIDYGFPIECAPMSEGQDLFVCMSLKTVSTERQAECSTQIRGQCRNGVFNAGIERFYIPESKATELTTALRERPSSILISILKNGHAQVKSLRIDGKNWNQ